MFSLVIAQVTISELMVDGANLERQNNNVRAIEHKMLDSAEFERRLEWSVRGFFPAFNTYFNYRKVIHRNEGQPKIHLRRVYHQDMYDVCSHRQKTCFNVYGLKQLCFQYYRIVY